VRSEPPPLILVSYAKNSHMQGNDTIGLVYDHIVQIDDQTWTSCQINSASKEQNESIVDILKVVCY
jgi:hypothetical protein